MSRRQYSPRKSSMTRVFPVPGRLFAAAVALVLMTLIVVACAGAEPTSEAEEPTEGEAEATLPPQTAEPLPTATAVYSGPTPVPTPTIEERIAEVEWPSSMRVGDGEVVRLALGVSPGGAHLTTPEIAGHEIDTTTIPLPVTRAGYDGYVNASLAAAGMEVTAAGPTRQGLQPGRGNTWRWTISAPQAGTYHIVINLTVSWEPEPGSDAPDLIEDSVWSRVLTVEARAPLGLSGPQTDWLGLGGTVLGTVAGLPFVEKLLSTIWKRLRGRRGKAPTVD